MSFTLLLHIAFWCALVPFALFCWNLLLYREPPAAAGALPAISVLIPARNEEANIGAALKAALSSRGVEFEVLVLDDGSTDRTAEIVRAIAVRDTRVRYLAGPALARGWAGKAHAAHLLAGYAQHPVFCFVDADVRLAPDALARMLTFLRRTHAAMVSGFPRQIAVTLAEWLLLPLMHFLLLSYLPIAGMRRFRVPGFGAGCGQCLMVRRDAYEATGGYASIRASMHDGITMSKLLRSAGYHTDIADLTHLASCRMYRNATEVWNGLLKNATEGLAAPARIVPFTLLLLAGQVLPLLLLLYIAGHWSAIARGQQVELVTTAAAAFTSRLLCSCRFRQPLRSAMAHPGGILALLVLQWYALGRKMLGRKAVWKERAFDVG